MGLVRTRSNIILLVSLILLSSFSMNTFVKRDSISDRFVKKLNFIGKNKLSQIMLTNEDVFDESFFEIRNDSIFITDSNSKILNIFPISEVQHIIYKDRIISMVHGAFFGGFASLVPLAGSGPEPVNATLIIGTGILVGGIIGFISGSYQYYEFKD